MNEKLTIRTKKSCDIPKKQAKKQGDVRAHTAKKRARMGAFFGVFWQGDFPGNARGRRAWA